MKRIWIASLFSLWLIGGTVHADVIFQLDNVEVNPGETARVGVFVSGSVGESLEAYDLPIEIGGNGFGLVPGIVSYGFVNQQTFSTVSLSNDGLPNGLTKNFEAVFSDAGQPIALSSTPRRLFDLLVVADGTFSGTTPVSIFSSADQDQSVLKPLNVVTSLPAVAGSQETFRVAGTPQAGRTLTLLPGSISAVPEPGAMAVLGMLLGTVGLRQRRKVS